MKKEKTEIKLFKNYLQAQLKIPMGSPLVGEHLDILSKKYNVFFNHVHRDWTPSAANIEECGMVLEGNVFIAIQGSRENLDKFIKKIYS